MPSFMPIGPKRWALEGYTQTNRQTDNPSYFDYPVTKALSHKSSKKKKFLCRDSINVHACIFFITCFCVVISFSKWGVYLFSDHFPYWTFIQVCPFIWSIDWKSKNFLPITNSLLGIQTSGPSGTLLILIGRSKMCSVVQTDKHVKKGPQHSYTHSFHWPSQQ